MTPVARVPEAVARLKAVFVEIPGMQMSIADASRLSGVERTVCLYILEALEDARFVARTRNGLFVRRPADSPLS